MPRSNVIAWAFIVLAVVYLTVLGGGAFTGLYILELRIVSVASATVAVLIWLMVAARRPFWRPRTVLGPAIVAVLAALAVALATSDHPSLGIDYLAYAGLLASAYLLLQRLSAHRYVAPRLGSLAVLLGFSLSIAYIVVVVIRWIEIWSYLGRLVTPPLRPGYEALLYGNPSAVAAAVILLWLVSAAHLGFTTARARALLALLGVLTAVVVLLSGSRGAWAGLAIAVAIIGPAWMLVGSHRRVVVDVFRSRMARTVGAVTLLAMAVFAVALLPAVLSRLSQGAAELRSALVAAAWQMFLEDPATGVGPGMYVVERARHTQPSEVDFYVAHAHNIFAQTLAELGLVGFVAAIAITVNVGILILRGIRSDDPLRQRLGWAAMAGVSYLAAHQLFDFYMNMPALGLLLALTVARLDALATETDTSPVRPAPVSTAESRRWPLAAPALTMAAILVGTVLATSWLARTEGIALIARGATAAGNRGDWPTAYERAQVAVDADPDMPPYLFTLGLAAANLGNLDAARNAFQQSATIDNYPTSWLNVAKLETVLGNAAAARAALSNAMRLGYQQPQVAVGAASLYVELGDTDAAAVAVFNALVDAPGLAGDPYWKSSPGLAAAWSSGLSLALERMPGERAYEVALEAGQPDIARQIVLALPEPSRATLSAVVEAWTGDAEGFATLRAMATDNPFDGHIVALCHRVATHARAELGLDPAIWQCDRAGFAFDPIVFRVGEPPTSRVALPGPNASWHFQGAYERFVPFDELVPGLPRLRAI